MVLTIMENEAEKQTPAVSINLFVNVVGCKEDNIQQNIESVIKGVKAEIPSFPVNLTINLHLQNGELVIQNLDNFNTEDNSKWN